MKFDSDMLGIGHAPFSGAAHGSHRFLCVCGADRSIVWTKN